MIITIMTNALCFVNLSSGQNWFSIERELCTVRTWNWNKIVNICSINNNCNIPVIQVDYAFFFSHHQNCLKRRLAYASLVKSACSQEHKPGLQHCLACCLFQWNPHQFYFQWFEWGHELDRGQCHADHHGNAVGCLHHRHDRNPAEARHQDPTEV